MDAKQTLIAWLNDAYGMEHTTARILENRIADTKDMPQTQAVYKQHLETTKRQAERVKGCIERLGGSTSRIKTGIANITGLFQAVSTAPFGDELVKNCLADFAVEHFEYASYLALVAAAKELGDAETARVCQEIADEEEQTARWVKSQIPTVVSEYLVSKGMGRKAA